MIVPNVISVAPVFAVNLRAAAKSESGMTISTGESLKSETFSAAFYHEGIIDNVKIASDDSKPLIKKSPSRAKFNYKSAIKTTGETMLFLEFMPSLKLSISIFGKFTPKEVINKTLSLR